MLGGLERHSQNFQVQQTWYVRKNKHTTSNHVLLFTMDDDHLQSLQAAALKATRCAATLPPDIHFYRSLDSIVAHDIDALHSRLLSLTNRLLQYSSAHPTHTPLLHDHDSLLVDFQPLVVHVMDDLFERTVSLFFFSLVLIRL